MGHPAPFDWMWHHWYLVRFAGEDRCGHHALDLKTFAMAALRVPFHASSKRNHPPAWSMCRRRTTTPPSPMPAAWR